MARELEVDATYDRVLAILRAAIRASGRTQIQLDAAIGRRRGYLSHVFQHRVELKLRDILKVLRSLRLDPSLVLGSLVLKGRDAPAPPKGEQPAAEETETGAGGGELEGLIEAILEAMPPSEDTPQGGGETAEDGPPPEGSPPQEGGPPAGDPPADAPPPAP
jgi:hypothetical protein